MRGAITEANGTGPPVPEGRLDARVSAPPLAFLYASGATVLLASVALPHPGMDRPAGIVGIAVVAYAVAAVLVAFPGKLDVRACHLVLALGTALITLAIYLGREGGLYYSVFYVWVGLYAFYFFTAAQAAMHVLFVGAAYAAVMLVAPAQAPLTGWVVTLGTATVAGVFVGRLVEQIRARAWEAADRADRLAAADSEMREQIEDLGVVAGVARDLAGVTSPHAARPAICKAAVQIAGATLGILFEADPKGVELVSTAVYGGPDRRTHLPFAGGTSGAGTAFSSGRPLFVSDLKGHDGVRQRIAEELGVASALWQPIVRNGVPVAVLAVAWTERVERVTPRVEALIALLAADAVVAIERADLLGRLEAVARTDDLTGLANRRAWEEQLPRELARARRSNAPLCVAMLDLDRFKAFNDRHGHPAGDRLLKEVTAAWRSLLRPSDVLARYGGEEFALLLPDCSLEGAIEVVDRLRDVNSEGQTCSAGMVEWDGREAPAALVDRADHALYEAKKAGRDRSVWR